MAQCPIGWHQTPRRLRSWLAHNTTYIHVHMHGKKGQQSITIEVKIKQAVKSSREKHGFYNNILVSHKTNGNCHHHQQWQLAIFLQVSHIQSITLQLSIQTKSTHCLGLGLDSTQQVIEQDQLEVDSKPTQSHLCCFLNPINKKLY